MKPYDSSGYQVDNRYKGLQQASDNNKAKEFLERYSSTSKPTLTEDRQNENVFVMSSPGWGTGYTYRNAYGSPRSPAQRRLSNLNQ